MKEPKIAEKPKSKTTEDRRLELAVDPYHDGICKQVASRLKKRGVQVRSKEGLVRRSPDRLNWEVAFPQGTAEVSYSYRSKEWMAGRWHPTVEKEEG